MRDIRMPQPLLVVGHVLRYRLSGGVAKIGSLDW
jgi:hypothetical protein